MGVSCFRTLHTLSFTEHPRCCSTDIVNTKEEEKHSLTNEKAGHRKKKKEVLSKSVKISSCHKSSCSGTSSLFGSFIKKKNDNIIGLNWKMINHLLAFCLENSLFNAVENLVIRLVLMLFPVCMLVTRPLFYLSLILTSQLTYSPDNMHVF